MEKIIWNGKIINREDAKVDIEDRGYQFGDGVYEVIRVYNRYMFTPDEHLERLKESAEKIKLSIPYSLEQMREWLLKLLSENDIENGIVYIQVSRGVSPRNHLFPAVDAPIVFVANTKTVERPIDNMLQGVNAITVEDIRWLKCDIKSLNLLGNLLAKQTAFENGCFEAIQHRSEIVTEGSSSNISIVVNGKVITHPANHLILNGIVRQVMLKTCEENGIPFEETAFTIKELFTADEVFMTSTTAEITPIVQIDGKLVSDGKPGKTTKRLQDLYEQEIKKQCEFSITH